MSDGTPPLVPSENEGRETSGEDAGVGREAYGARHVAIIMDGNGRWAKARHLPRVVGHQRGVEAVRNWCGPAGAWGSTA